VNIMKVKTINPLGMDNKLDTGEEKDRNMSLQ
jgi:hypothetical protein